MIKSLKNLAKMAIDAVVMPAIGYVAQKIPSTTVIRELEKRAAQESAGYAEERMPAALQFHRRRDLWDFALGKAPSAGIVAEFGVWKGESINHIAERLDPAPVFGFDSFEGLREDWSGWSEPKGTFSLGGRLPRVRPNVRLVKGWFDATIPAFLEGHGGPFALVHLDSDTYESTKTVLDLIGPRLAAGTVIIFDEYFGYRGWRIGEFRAWQEFVQRRGVAYDYLAFSNQSVAVRVSRT
jgi:hypothetical protein